MRGRFVQRRTLPAEAPDTMPFAEGTLKFSLQNLLTEGSALASLWRQEQLCDVVLYASDGVAIKSHKLVLASISPFFRALFTGTGCEMTENRSRLPSGENVVTLQGVTGSGLQSVMNAVYTNTLEISSVNIETVLDTANVLEFPIIRDVCCEYLRWMLNVENGLSVLELAERYDCFDLKDHAVNYICQRFSDVLLLPHLGSHIGALSKETVLQIIQNQDITVESERQILTFALEWIRANPTSSNTEAGEILAHIRLPASILTSEVEAAGLNPSDLLCMLPRQETPHDVDIRSRVPTHIFVAGGHDASWRTFKTAELYNPLDDTWSSAPSMPTAFSLAGAASLSRSVFVIGGSMYNANVCRYDKRHHHWKHCTPLKTSKIHAGVAGVGSALYVCGGRTGLSGSSTSTEVLQEGEAIDWLDGPEMCEARCSFGLASIHGDLYAVGGQSEWHIHHSVEVLSYGAERWTLLASSRLITPRKYFSLCSAAGRLYAIGGLNEQRFRLSSVEALDPREGKWHCVKDMSISRSSFGAATLNERLYVLGGNSGDDEANDGMECYVPEANEWMTCASLSCGRSGLSAVAI